ncbi:CHAT domain-containing protein [Tahibacter sp. UC22_41]|uniref:CHAT domain-containing tetratricopeptide repeat protein n=1 Tax=Tahibacter sp. UC22_41 TaxID=3350178 RepID=UPI0036DAF486
MQPPAKLTDRRRVAGVVVLCVLTAAVAVAVLALRPAAAPATATVAPPAMVAALPAPEGASPSPAFPSPLSQSPVPATAPAAPLVPLEPLPAGMPLQLTLRPDESRRFALPENSAPLRLRIVEQGIDVTAELIVGSARLQFSENDLYRYGEHRLALAEATAASELQLRASRLGSPEGKVELSLETLTPAAAAAPRFRLDLAETELAQRLADRQRNRDPATAEFAATLCANRLAQQDDDGYLRCVSLQERVLAKQSQRAPAIASLERALPVWQRRGDPHALATALNNIGMHHYRSGNLVAAEVPLRRALSVLERVDDPLLSATVYSNFCLNRMPRVSSVETRRCNEKALSLSRASGDGPRIATALNNLGGAYWMLGEMDRAADYFEQSVAGWKAVGTPRDGRDPLNNLALVQLGRGRLSDAARGFERARSAYDGDAQGLLRVLRNLGGVQLLLGETALAVDLQQQALELARSQNRPDQIVLTLGRLAEAQLADNQVERARASVELAVAEAQKATGSPQLAIESQLRAARIHRRSGAPDKALAAAQQAVDASAVLERDKLHDLARIELGHAQLQQGDAAQAQRQTDAVLGSRRLTPLQRIEAQTLRADALRAQGSRRAAETAYRQAIAEVDEAGSWVYDLEQRATFLASQRDAQVGLLSLLMEDVDTAGRPRRAADALALSERFRARSLRARLDAMPLPAATDASAESQRERVQTQLAALAISRWKLQDDHEPAVEERRRHIEADIRSAEATLRTLDGAAAPDPAASVAGVSLAQLQRALPKDTSLVIYRTLPQASYAWVVQRDAFHSAQLDAQDVLAARVREARVSLGAEGEAQGADWQQALRNACDAIWQPIAAQVDTPRVLVVGDTALDGLPFAALRCGETPTYLLEHHEITLLPATWLLLRPPQRELRADFAALLIGDPVYARDDPRLGLAPAAPSPDALRRDGPGRLRGSGDEIRRVRDRLGAARSTLLAGFDASIATLRSSAMEKYDIVHFATHGTGDRGGASGSGLVLSLFDAQGRGVDGFLSARRIGASRLPAALVVLGACDTATGRAVQDEGTFGVAYAFLQAGARHVVATLWPVDDAAMPELMDRFYADPRLAAEHPARALRQAQRALLQQYPAANPALWAGVAVWGW